MGWFKKEAKNFGREFARQGSILAFGRASKPKRKQRPRRITGAERQYHKAQAWAKFAWYKN